MATTRYKPADPAEVRDCNRCGNADWDRDTEWGRCVERKSKHQPESGIHTIHRRMMFDECGQYVAINSERAIA